MIAAAAAVRPARGKRVLPGFTVSLGATLLYLALIVVIPVAALVLKGAEIGLDRFLAIVTGPRALAAFQVTLTAALIATAFNVVYDLLMAWALVREDFPGKSVVDALMDIPFALPTAVAGLALTALFSANGRYGGVLDAMGVQVVYTIRA